MALNIVHFICSLLVAAAGVTFQINFSALCCFPDALSHFNWPAFSHLAPNADCQPAVIPPPLWESLTCRPGKALWARVGSTCPAGGWTLCLFATHLSSSLYSSPIRVCLFVCCLFNALSSWPSRSIGWLPAVAACPAWDKAYTGSTGPSHIRITDCFYMQVPLLFQPRSCYVLGCLHPCLLWFSPLLQICSFILDSPQPPHSPVNWP